MSSEHEAKASSLVAGMTSKQYQVVEKGLEGVLGHVLHSIVLHLSKQGQLEPMVWAQKSELCHKLFGLEKGREMQKAAFAQLARRLEHFHPDQPVVMRVVSILQTRETAPHLALHQAQQWLLEVMPEDYEETMARTISHRVFHGGFWGNEQTFRGFISRLFPRMVSPSAHE
ncbi:MAG: hypothetical protein WAX89_02130 [Alphaproteobacteria bacterium]